MQNYDQQIQQAFTALQQGNRQDAASRADAVLRDCPQYAAAHHLRGVIHLTQNEMPEAYTCLKNAVRHDGSNPTFLNNYGVALQKLDRLTEALQAFQTASRQNPHYLDAQLNTARATYELGDYPLAIDASLLVVSSYPNQIESIARLAECYLHLGHHVKSLEYFERLKLLTANDTRPLRRLGDLFFAKQDIHTATEIYQTAAALQPQNAGLQLRLGAVLAEDQQLPDAEKHLENAVRLDPDEPWWQLRHLGISPRVFIDSESIAVYRGQLESGIEKHRANRLPLDWRNAATEGVYPPFTLAHHGLGTRQIKEPFARLFESIFPQESPSVRSTGRYRVGFLVTRYREGGFLRNSRHLIERLDPQRFEVALFCPRATESMLRSAVRRDDIRWIPFPSHFGKAAETVRAAGCDLIYHHQIGTDAMNYFLPMTRPSAIQCTGWGTHGTTGISSVDHYLSSALMEDEQAQQHYTEQLELFDTFPTIQQRPEKPPEATRSDFNLPETGGLYFCPHRLEKFHPDFDPLLQGILQHDPAGHILILTQDHPNSVAILRQRLEQTLGQSLVSRIRFLGRLSPHDYLCLFSLADVMLDAPHYSSSLTGFDALSLGVPIVTLPGKYNVQRYALGLYRRIGIHEFIADSEQSYINRAVRLGTNDDYRTDWQNQIRQQNDHLFNDNQPVINFQDFAEKAIETARMQ